MTPNPLAFLAVAATTSWGAAFGEPFIGLAVGLTAVTVVTGAAMAQGRGEPSPNDLEGREE